MERWTNSEEGAWSEHPDGDWVKYEEALAAVAQARREGVEAALAVAAHEAAEWGKARDVSDKQRVRIGVLCRALRAVEAGILNLLAAAPGEQAAMDELFKDAPTLEQYAKDNPEWGTAADSAAPGGGQGEGVDDGNEHREVAPQVNASAETAECEAPPLRPEVPQDSVASSPPTPSRVEALKACVVQRAKAWRPQVLFTEDNYRAENALVIAVDALLAAEAEEGRPK